MATNEKATNTVCVGCEYGVSVEITPDGTVCHWTKHGPPSPCLYNGQNGGEAWITCEGCDLRTPPENMIGKLCEECKNDRDADADLYYDDCGDYNDAPFRDPGGNSALRAGEIEFPCPNCGEITLTAADKARGYQCDTCADKAERGYD